jgi:hypothetical protein
MRFGSRYRSSADRKPSSVTSRERSTPFPCVPHSFLPYDGLLFPNPVMEELATIPPLALMSSIELWMAIFNPDADELEQFCDNTVKEVVLPKNAA